MRSGGFTNRKPYIGFKSHMAVLSIRCRGISVAMLQVATETRLSGRAVRACPRHPVKRYSTYNVLFIDLNID